MGSALEFSMTTFSSSRPTRRSGPKSQGCKPWVYSIAKDGSVRDIAYWSLPDTAADDGDEAVKLVRRSFGVAKIAAEAKAKKPKKKTAAKPAPKKAAARKAPARKAPA